MLCLSCTPERSRQRPLTSLRFRNTGTCTVVVGRSASEVQALRVDNPNHAETTASSRKTHKPRAMNPVLLLGQHVIPIRAFCLRGLVFVFVTQVFYLPFLC